MSWALRFRVYGDPRPQGSKKLLGHGAVVESGGLPLKAWRSDMRDATMTALAGGHRLAGPVEVQVVFLMRRPRSHFSTAKGHENDLKAKAPLFHTQRPDVDKLQRALLDAMTSAGAYSDDSQVVHVSASKAWTDAGELPGALVSVQPLVREPAGAVS